MRDLYVKTLSVQIEVADALYNETLKKDTLWEKPTDALAGSLYRLIYLKPRESGLVSISIHADYQYTDGDQTFEREGTFELVNVANVFSNTYIDLMMEIGGLKDEVHNLNSSIQNLDAYNSTLTSWMYFLAITSCALFATTLLALISYKRKKPVRT